ncbi:MAG: PQQ-dependent sugar dehydrogenase [Methylophilaceae bacterium]
MHFNLLVLISLFGLSFSACANEAMVSPVPKNVAAAIQLPQGFKLNVFADLHQNAQLNADSQPRMMAFDAMGNLYVSLTTQGKVVKFDKNIQNPTIAGQMTIIASDLNAPQGLAIVGEKLYVANQDGIVAINKNSAKAEVIVKGLPTDGHAYKSLKLGPDGYLYVNVGSSCNVCVERDPLRATILRYSLQGKPAGAMGVGAVYATGLRNSQGFTWHPKTKAMFATNNGADNRTFVKNGEADESIPPEHLNQIMPGRNYGWPYCWGNSSTDRVDKEDQKSNPHRWGMLFTDPNFKGEDGFCDKATAPAMVFEAHSTPIGITFLNQSHFSKAYQNDAIVALHGSWNRQNPSGYKLMRVMFKGDKPVFTEDFATGWLKNGAAFGRPVDVQVGQDGALYVSDDRAGLIYRISNK